MRAWRLPSLRTQLLISFVVVAVLAAVLVALSATVLRRQALLDAAVDGALQTLNEDLLVAGRWVNERGERAATDGDSARLLRDDDLLELGSALTSEDGPGLLIVQPGGQSTYLSRPDLGTEVPGGLRDIVQMGMIGEQRVRGPDGTVLMVGGRVASDALAIYRVVDLQPVDADLASMRRTLARAGVVPLVAALLLGFLAAGRLLRPVRRARDAAERLGAGALDTRLPVRGDDELAQLSGSFNDMAGSLQDLVEELRAMEERQRRFVADVSHELRTPLTALVAAVEVLEDELGGEHVDGPVRGVDDRREATQLAIDEVRGMRDLVEDLMEIARFDAGHALLDQRPTRVTDAVAGTLRRRGYADDVEVHGDAGLSAMIDPRRLDTIVANLVGNALSHGGRPVEVHARAARQDLVLDVVDAGPGVPEHLRDRLFERFTKADEARTRSGGSGLGLAIARENARLHGGEVTLVATGPTGTRMRLTLPGSVLPLTAEGADPTDTVDGPSSTVSGPTVQADAEVLP